MSLIEYLQTGLLVVALIAMIVSTRKQRRMLQTLRDMNRKWKA
jgi:hypothetical protein